MYTRRHACYDRPNPSEDTMATTRLFRNGNSQAVRIPAELAYPSSELEMEIERRGDEILIRPARRRIGDVLGALRALGADFMPQGRGVNRDRERGAL
jgi:antitoxin VapB